MNLRKPKMIGDLTGGVKGNEAGVEIMTLMTSEVEMAGILGDKAIIEARIKGSTTRLLSMMNTTEHHHESIIRTSHL